jgi:prephenate dehydrogenase
MKIGILGLGLIGGSFAKATKAATSHVIYGADKNRETLRRALAEGTVDGILDETTLGECDLLLLAVRPGAAVDYALQCTKFPPFVVDLCGVKRVVSEKLLPLSAERGFRYIGGHPMAGKEVGGYENSSANLFEGASMILVPHGGDIPSLLKEYFAALGFQTLKISDDEEHDRVLAFTSQLAHVVSNAFVKSKTAEEHVGYSADSLKDLTRVATLDSDMWTELFLANGDYLVGEIDGLIRELEKYRRAISDKDAEALKLYLEEGCTAKERIYPKGKTEEERL